ncbi:hypothetical protein [Lysobacter xanthus]
MTELQALEDLGTGIAAPRPDMDRCRAVLAAPQHLCCMVWVPDLSSAEVADELAA